MPADRNSNWRTCFFLLLISFPSARGFAEQPSSRNDWTIVPGQRVGPITLDTSEDKLREFFGAGNVQREDIGVGEGVAEPGTVIFPNTRRQLSIFWLAPTVRDRIKEIRINSDKSVWKTNKGITVGTSLKQIEKINERPFLLMGFAWDYAGTIVDCHSGRLKEVGCVDPTDSAGALRGRAILLRLAPVKAFDKMTATERKNFRAVMGDAVFSSGHPAMQRLNPQIYEMIVWLGQQDH